MKENLRWIVFVLAANVMICQKLVITKRGPIVGQKEDGYYTFLGVPYALVNEENPFGASSEYPKFDEAFNASDPDVKCPQILMNEGGVIQCLTLNIYVPKIALKESVPVFVWFYGGGYVFGSAGLYHGKLLVKKDIIVVTVNYRLGPYGFLCLDDPRVPGNQGLKDQADALKWINENIGAFGGDNEEITIAGESYGGGSVDLHLYSKYPTYFNKAIIQSGAAEARRMFVKPDYSAAIKLANHLGSTNSTTNDDSIKFLKQVDPLTVMKGASKLGMVLTVCKEKRYESVRNFITDDQFHLRNPFRIKNTPIMIGYNSKEAFDTFANKSEEVYQKASTFIYDNFKEIFDLKEDALVRLTNIVHSYYMGGKPFDSNAMLELIDMSGDFILNRAIESSVTRFIEQGAKKVYKYLFSYIGGSIYENITGVGAYHTEELQYLFHSVSPGKKFTAEQKIMRNRMTTMWSNFVKYGNPTPNVTDLLPVEWLPITSEGSRVYLNIDLDMSMKDQLYHKRIAFWDLFWSSYWKKAKMVTKKCRTKCAS
ncbi:juvenile hormone esterase [Plodia interpunctella]|uniref:Carboxylesterase n=1 Tax=Plodia interpunctella TaxID=58824 RepID=A0A5B8R9M7_PLOIN|nr:juvenile hormone esterase-like [Plodia interpunctella]QEA03468.1 carboxylesterase [Plodia interpunctella]